MESDFLYLVETELAKAREKHQQPIHTPHEAYGVIMEEVCEFFDEVRAQEHSKPEMLKELVQIAAMCYRAAEDLHLVGFEPESEWLKPSSELELKRAVDALCDHKGMRFRADDPNQQKLGMSINYKCVHQVEWTVTGPCIESLSLSQFETPCDCPPICNTSQEEEYCRELRLKSAYKEGEL